jgi:hypothetical protein
MGMSKVHGSVDHSHFTLNLIISKSLIIHLYFGLLEIECIRLELLSKTNDDI